MEEVKEILREVKGNSDFEKSNNFVDDGIFDSLDIVRIINLIEKKYEIEVSPDDIDVDNFVSIESIKQVIAKNKEQRTR